MQRVLDKYLRIVKSIIGDSVPFFIAGGSVFSALNQHTDFSADLDVYFWYQKDYDDAMGKIESSQIKYKNENCIDLKPVTSGEPNVQLIRKNFGTPEEIFANFDLTCCKCAITHTGEILKAHDYSNIIDINLDVFKSNCLKRYRRYTKEKGAIDPHNQCLQKIYDYLVPRAFDKIPRSYSSNEEEGLVILSGDMIAGSASDLDMLYIHDAVINTFETHDRIKFFDQSHSLKIPYDKASDEYLLKKVQYELQRRQWSSYEIMASRDKDMTPEIMERVQDVFPEYFV